MIGRTLNKRRFFVLPLLALIAINGEAMSENLRIAYIEASIGNAWKLESFAERMQMPHVSIEFHDVYDFDKSAKLGEILDRRDKPDLIAMQECSVYFPGDFESYRSSYIGWIEKIREHGIKPVIVTTVPPAGSFGLYRDFKNFIKKYVLGRESQFEQITRFNDWLNEYAGSNGITVLDLEKALRISESDRHMNDIYDYGDGIHLNEKAYEVLDLLLKDTLAEISSPAQPDPD